jgi:hypothetical protein
MTLLFTLTEPTLSGLPTWLVRLIDIAGLAAAATGIATAFEWVEGALNPAAKKAISDWLKNLPVESRFENWSSPLSHLIDHVFGPKPWSVKFFLRSCVASAIAVVVVSAIYYRAHPIPVDDLRDSLLVLGLFSIPNFLPDYGSLAISRTIVQRMVNKPTAGRVASLLAIDTVLKLIGATCVIYICSVFLHWLPGHSPHAWFEALGTLRGFYAGLPFPFRSGGGIQIGIFFYASFFTSIWVWFYVLGGVLIKGLVKTGRLWRWLAPYLDLDASPLKAIGRVIAASIGILYAVGIGVLSIAGRVSKT